MADRFLLTSLLLLTLFAEASRIPLDSRKVFDPFIMCVGITPPATAAWPEGYHADDYDRVLDICSAANGARQNVGCICLSSNGRLDCDTSVGDPDLAAAEIRNQMTFLEFCKRSCRCVTQEQAKQASVFTRPPWWQLLAAAGVDPQNNQAASESTEDLSSATPNESNINQCGSNCTSNPDCSPISGQSLCVCRASSSTYEPGTGVIAYMAACMVSLGGKRDSDGPCPCNSSYVSYACCQASNGIVQEDKAFNLGKLLGV